MPSPALLPLSGSATSSTETPWLSLSPDQARAVDLLLSGECRTQREVAKRLGYREETVSSWNRDPAFREAMDLGRRVMQEASLDRLRLAGPEAADTLVEIATGREPILPEMVPGIKARMDASTEILDRIGVGKVQRIESTSTSRSESVTLTATADLPEDLAAELHAWRQRRSTSSNEPSTPSEGGG